MIVKKTSHFEQHTIIDPFLTPQNLSFQFVVLALLQCERTAGGVELPFKGGSDLEHAAFFAFSL
jgi:hypothetical protein